MQFKNIPLEMRQHIAWVLWRYEDRNGKPTKVPYSAKTGRNAKSDDAQTWSSFEEVAAAFNSGNWSGIGFVLSGRDPYFVIDLDDPERQPAEKRAEIENRYSRIIQAIGETYMETSPSGKGIHIFGRGKLPSGRRKKDGVEIYDDGRFITMTGWYFQNSRIANRQEFAAQLVASMSSGSENSGEFDAGEFFTTATENDEAVYTKAANASNAAKFLALWNGDGSVLEGSDQSGSAIDQAIVNILAFYTSDPHQIERLWLGSPHGQNPERRKKLARNDYRERTIRMAFDKFVADPMGPDFRTRMERETRRSQQGSSEGGNRSGPISARDLANMEFAPIKYVVPGLVAEGLTLFAGRPKLGKSWACLEIAIAVASGGDCFGNLPCEHGEVLYLALEDNRRRLKSRLGKLSNNNALAIPDGLYFETEWPRDPDGVGKIREWLSAHPNAKMVIVDVLAAFRAVNKGKQQQYDADYVAIKGLQMLASEFGIAIVIVHHTRKAREEVDPVEAVSGTLGLSGAADTVIVLGRDTAGCTLYGRGRDIQEFEFAAQFDAETCRWQLLGHPNEARRSDERTKIIEFLKSSGGSKSPKDIADATGMPDANVRKLLGSMVEAGEVIKIARGEYAYMPTGRGGLF